MDALLAVSELGTQLAVNVRQDILLGEQHEDLDDQQTYGGNLQKAPHRTTAALGQWRNQCTEDLARGRNPAKRLHRDCAMAEGTTARPCQCICGVCTLHVTRMSREEDPG